MMAIKPINKAKKMQVKEPFKHGKTLYAKGDVASFGAGALEKYASFLEEAKALPKK